MFNEVFEPLDRPPFVDGVVVLNAGDQIFKAGTLDGWAIVKSCGDLSFPFRELPSSFAFINGPGAFVKCAAIPGDHNPRIIVMTLS
jgi:hypothetical protein